MPTLTPDDLCEEASQAVALRTLQCTNDPDLANAAYDAWANATTCVATADTGTIDAQMACPAELLATPCAEVTTRSAQAGWWFAQSPSCAATVTVTQTTPPTTTPPTSDVPGSCASPLLVDLTGPSAFTRVDRALAPDLPDVHGFTNCGPDQRVDVYLDVSTDQPGEVWVALQGADGQQAQAGTLPTNACDGYLAVCTPFLGGAEPTVYRSANGPETRRLVLQIDGDPDAITVQVGQRP